MRILGLFITYPHKPINHNMFKDLTEKLVDEGHEVDVITINERKYKKQTYIDNHNGVNVLRVKTLNFFDTNFIEKGFSMLSLGYLFKKAFKKHLEDNKYDLVIHSCPPVTYLPLLKYIKSKYDVYTYLILRDIFPDNAKDMKAMNSVLYDFFKKQELKNYSYSNSIGCMSPKNIEYVTVNNDLSEKKFHILENWSRDINLEMNPEDKKNILEKYEALEQFNIIFGGNMGPAQSLGFILDMANQIYEIDSQINFIFVGRGLQKEMLEKRIINEDIKNIKIFDYVPREDYEQLINSCDLGLVSLNTRYTIPNIPSKTVDYFKLSLPVIACIDENTDYGFIIQEKAKAGLYSIHGDKKAFISNLLKIKKNNQLYNQMKLNAREYYEKHHKPKIAANIILNEYYSRGEHNEL